MKVMKFGGSSVRSSEQIKKVLAVLRQSYEEDRKIALVFSAFGGVTDKLIQMSRAAAVRNEKYKEQLSQLESKHLTIVSNLVRIKNRSRILAQVKMKINELEDVLHGIYLVKELSPKTLDFILSFGERLSAYIISEAIKEAGFEAEYLDARRIIKTDDSFGSANVIRDLSYKNITNHFKKHRNIQIITGFISSTLNDETTTLGRGGSDLTASLIAAALKASVLELWTDVNGVMSADPRKVADAFPIPSLTYEEAMELSHFGAKVIFPPTIQPVMEQRILTVIKNTFNPEFHGTTISTQLQSTQSLIKGISSIENIALLRVQGSGMIGVAGIAARLFSALANENINIILITQASSEHSICFAVTFNAAAKAKKVVEKEFALEIQTRYVDEVVVEKGYTILAVVGENMRRIPGISGKLFHSLGARGVNVVAIAQGSSELNISIVVAEREETLALNSIHETFFLKAGKH